jgi:hypothetical protein
MVGLISDSFQRNTDAHAVSVFFLPLNYIRNGCVFEPLRKFRNIENEGVIEE